MGLSGDPQNRVKSMFQGERESGAREQTQQLRFLGPFRQEFSTLLTLQPFNQVFMLG